MQSRSDRCGGIHEKDAFIGIPLFRFINLWYSRCACGFVRGEPGIARYRWKEGSEEESSSHTGYSNRIAGIDGRGVYSVPTGSYPPEENYYYENTEIYRAEGGEYRVIEIIPGEHADGKQHEGYPCGENRHQAESRK